ncbi:HNH endonuclease [Myxosarcina sp. GI1]|uniref:HNH endonuclease n=1 Tax=Myxosarcina sp. GI1 TaxID=1541065 RepID=UPI000563597B|nr:HNH endonuclease signature motif containing protein [Myxosarcina sp. GI1]
MDENKKLSQKEFIFQYYLERPNRAIKHQDIIPKIVEAWQELYETPLADPDRAIRKLFEEGRLVKVKKGVYKYDPNYVAIAKADTFPEAMRQEIFARDNYKCVICGQGKKEGLEIHADHIRPRELGGENTIENGQTLCSRHNMLKKNLHQTETGKKMFIKLYDLAKKEKDERLVNFALEILSIYEKHNINGHISWQEE